MNEFDKNLHQINEELSKINMPDAPAGLFDPIKYIISLGGKRIRPVFTLMANSLYSSNTNDVMPIALAIEIFHNFTLLHDDLMDNAEMRRNKSTVHKVWDDNTAILSGDAMQIIAYQQLALTPEKYLKKIIDIFSQTALEICKGQQYDMEFESDLSVTEDQYIEMIRLKTAVLLGCSLKCGAIIGGADDADIQRLYDIGINIGLAFQLRDDYLDVYGDSEVFGKIIGGDIISNKKTYMLIKALVNANQMQRAELKEWINKKTFLREEKVRAVTAIYNELNISQICLEKIDDYFASALQLIDDLNVSHEKKKPLIDLANSLMSREN